MMTFEIFQNQTLNIVIRVLDGDKNVVDLTGATITLRIGFLFVTAIFPASWDAVTGRVTAIVDRDVTKTWRSGEYDFQIWADFGEGASPLENDVLYADRLLVKKGLF